MSESKQNEIYLDKDGIVRATLNGRLIKDEIVRLRDELLEFRTQIQGKRLRLLVDIANLKGISFDARIEGISTVRVFEEIAQVAIIGADLFQSILSFFVVSLFGIGHKLRLFKNREEAINWLKEEQYKDTHFIK